MDTGRLERYNRVIDDLLLGFVVDYYETTDNVDRYGQIPISAHQVGNIIKDTKMVKDVIDFIEEGASNYFELKTYGGTTGIYKAIAVKDPSIRPKLQEALNKNKYVKQRLNSW
jgi:hypothetical protein